MKRVILVVLSLVALFVAFMVGVLVGSAPSSDMPGTEARSTAAASFPPGYPKRVKKSDLPDVVHGIIATEEAVQLAPGVWANLPTGLSVTDAATDAGSLYGYCASIKAYERVYANGEEHAGSCR